MAEAALEAREMGADVREITPFWRVLDASAPTTGRLPNGIAFVRERRAEEGID